MLSGVPRHRLGFWVTTPLTWREHQRLYFGFSQQHTLTWFLKIEPLNTTIRAQVYFIKLLFATSPQVNAGGASYLLIDVPRRGLRLATSGEPRSTRLRKVKSLSTAKKRPIQRRGNRRWTMDKDGAHDWTMPLTSVTLPHSLLLSPSYLCTTSQCFLTKSIGAVWN